MGISATQKATNLQSSWVFHPFVSPHNDGLIKADRQHLEQEQEGGQEQEEEMEARGFGLLTGGMEFEL